MPITRRQFELEIDTQMEEWMKKIHAFLGEHKDKAFTIAELYNEWQSVFDLRSLLLNERPSVEKALDKLVQLGAVEARTIRGESYYSYGDKPLEI